MKEPIGVTLTIPQAADALAVYEEEGGVRVFMTDAPYTLTNGSTLCAPLPVVVTDGPIFVNAMGNAVSALAVSGLSIVEPIINGVAYNGEQITYNGQIVTHTG